MKRRLVGSIALVSALGGCMDLSMPATEPSPEVTRAATPRPVSFSQANDSEIIESLLFRQSVIPEGSPYAKVATSVLAANARPAEADLRAAKLRSEAASKNWLPKIGPTISLTSLGSVVAGLLVEQVLFDNGRQKAERAFAAADVEAAAVTLYLQAEQAREASAVSARSAERMRYFHSIMGERVQGGVSDISDLRVVGTKLKEAENRLAADREAAQVALAELAAMSDRSPADIRGTVTLAKAPTEVKPLAVLMAEAERSRDIAQAQMTRADMLPGATLSGSIGDGIDTGIRVDTTQLLGVGTGAALEAVQAAKDAADRRVAHAVEESNRRLRRLSQQMTALSRQEGEAKDLAASAVANQDVFQSQFEAGARSIMDVISNYETSMRLERDYVRVKYDRARVRLEIASVFGALVNGSDI